MRAQLQIQFQWFFAIIGGFLFLLFFFMLIRTLVHSADVAQQRNLNFAADVILRTSLANPNTFTRTDLPAPVTFTFACELAPPPTPTTPPTPRGFDATHVRVNSESYTPYALRHIPFFSPQRVQGDQLFTLTRTWKAPFPITRLLMVSNNHTHYVVLVPTGWLARVKNFVKEENLKKFSFETRVASATGSLAARGADQYRYILFNTDFNAFYTNLDSQFKQPENSALVVTSDRDDFSTGTLRFYDDLSTGLISGPAINYYGAAMLDAAIFAGTRELYECNMQKAYERLYTTLATAVNRTRALFEEALAGALTPICGQQYSTLLGTLDTMPFSAIPHTPQLENPFWKEGRQEALPAYVYAVKVVLSNKDRYLACQQGPPDPSPGCTHPSLFQLAAQGEGPLLELEKKNTNLLKNDCPLIY
ncbi:hypothetical protein D6789_04470 [Candidatus Woesearchaeota archaeon]|nr:MAG: hypothetical protein D6789_04470 [Candidatus Woesearchaeota archaeon]